MSHRCHSILLGKNGRPLAEEFHDRFQLRGAETSAFPTSLFFFHQNPPQSLTPPQIFGTPLFSTLLFFYFSTLRRRPRAIARILKVFPARRDWARIILKDLVRHS